MSSTSSKGPDDDDLPNPRSELDSHANMVLLGRHSFIFDSQPGRTCDVQPFDPSIGTATKVPIVDGALAYDCPFSQKTYILIFRNALHIPSMTHNLIPPFILRKAGITVNEAAKIHCENPTSQDHAIIVKEPKVVIPLQLNGTFSFFHTRKPIQSELDSDNIIFFTPDSYSWNPYNNDYAESEEMMTDWNGDINNNRIKRRRLTSTNKVTWDLYEDQIDRMISSLTLQPGLVPGSADGNESTAILDSLSTSDDIFGSTMDSKMAQSIGVTQSDKDYDDEMFTKATDNDEMYETFFDGEEIGNMFMGLLCGETCTDTQRYTQEFISTPRRESYYCDTRAAPRHFEHLSIFLVSMVLLSGRNRYSISLPKGTSRTGFRANEK